MSAAVLGVASAVAGSAAGAGAAANTGAVGASVTTAALALIACVGAFVAGFCLLRMRLTWRARLQRRQKALGNMQVLRESTGGLRTIGLEYAANLNRRMFAGQTVALSPSVRIGKAAATRAGRRFMEGAQAAGVTAHVGVNAFCEARNRLTAIGIMGGALIGLVFSTEMGVVLAAAGGVIARSLPMRALRGAIAERRSDAERHLSEMLEVVALGLRSGLTFDRSFALYGAHFESGFAHSCALAQRRWALGLTTREEALRNLAASYECDQLARVVETIVRGLRFGSSLTGSLSEAAVQAREAYRTALAERVAKAPVKMMLPTGTLILPAMLLLVLGPILLELIGGF